MFGGSRSSNASDVRRSVSMDGLTGLERERLERTLHNNEPVYQAPVQSAQPQPLPVAVPNTRAAAAAAPQPIPAAGSAAHLHAGPGIKLKGEITGCDTLRVEGAVDGNATARQLILCPGGSFLGTAEIDEAEIEGNFDGTLNVRGRLLLRSNGRIAGTLSYGEIEVERGGEIAGQITAHGQHIAAKPQPGSAFVSVPNERRALIGSSAKSLLQPIVQTSRPAQPAEDAAAPASASAAVQPNPRTRLEQAAAGDPSSKARKVVFFGRG